jgi:hypothetical protein
MKWLTFPLLPHASFLPCNRRRLPAARRGVLFRRLRRPAYAALAFASPVLLAAGCTKEKLADCPGQCTQLTGQLLTSGWQPLAGVSVTASWRPLGLYAAPRTKARTTTDANGRYHVSLYVQDDERHDGAFELTYEADPGRYYVLSNTDGPDTCGAGLRRDTTYRLAPFLLPRKAFVKLTVPNPNQIQQYFSVDFSSAHLRTLTATKHSIGGGPAVPVPRQNDPFTTLVEIAGDQPVYVRATRGLNNGYTRTVDSLVVPAGTTRELTVRY